MTEAHKLFEEAAERHKEHHGGQGRLTPLLAAIIAVLASLATLFAHHRSTQALSIKNEAILSETKASDEYAYYQAKRIKYTLDSGLLAAGVAKDGKARAALQATSAHEDISSHTVLAAARALDKRSMAEDERSEALMQSFETLSIATTFLEVAIVLVSISTLSHTPTMLYLACGVSLIGVVLMIFGFVQVH